MDNSRVQQQTSVEIEIVILDEKERQTKSRETEQLFLEETACSTEDEIISKALGPKCSVISIRRQDMWTLKSSGWLNDQVRKFVLNIL